MIFSLLHLLFSRSTMVKNVKQWKNYLEKLCVLKMNSKVNFLEESRQKVLPIDVVQNSINLWRTKLNQLIQKRIPYLAKEDM